MTDYDDDDSDEEGGGSEIHQLWESLTDEFLLEKRIAADNRPFRSTDLCAFAYLDKLFPDDKNRDMVSAAEHDQIWLRITEEQIASLTKDDVLYLTRCGVFHDDEASVLSMFV